MHFTFSSIEQNILYFFMFFTTHTQRESASIFVPNNIFYRQICQRNIYDLLVIISYTGAFFTRKIIFGAKISVLEISTAKCDKKMFYIQGVS